MTDFAVRGAEPRDIPAVTTMAVALMQYHRDLDAQRFLPAAGVEEGARHFFAGLLRDRQTVLLVAERDGRIIGYAYARLEPRDWNALLDEHGALHDIYVIAEERRGGIATALLTEVIARLRALGAPRVVLTTAVQNEAAQRFFERHGFRRTMIEMTREIREPSPDASD